MDGCQCRPWVLEVLHRKWLPATSTSDTKSPRNQSSQAEMQLSYWVMGVQSCSSRMAKHQAVLQRSYRNNSSQLSPTPVQMPSASPKLHGLRRQDGQLPHRLLRNGRHLSRWVPSGWIPEGVSKAPAKGRCEHWSRAKHHKVFDRCWPHKVNFCCQLLEILVRIGHRN